MVRRLPVASLSHALVLVLLASGFIVAVTGSTQGSTPAPQIPHAAIVIEGNGEFTPEHGVVNGSGTPSDPYVIEGWEIYAPSGAGIFIRNSTAHFLVRDVTVWGGGPFDSGNYAIYLLNVQNGRVEDSVVFDTTIGILLVNSSNATISRNDVSGNFDGIYLVSSSRAVVSDNVATIETWLGIRVDNCSNVSVQRNLFSYCGARGIQLARTGPSLDLFVSENIVIGHAEYGIWIWNVDRSTVINNRIEANSYGVFVENCHGLSIYHNDFVNNSVSAYDDQGVDNSWDNGYPDGGNYWSDYAGDDQFGGPGQDVPGSDGIGDTPYVIDGNSQDDYPLMNLSPVAPPIEVTSPDGASVWYAGSTYEIEWNHTVASGDSVIIEYDYGTYDPWKAVTIASETENDGSYSWSIPGQFIPRDNYLIRITSLADWGIHDDSELFTIDAATYPSREPIAILSNDDFTPANGVVGGSGMALDPWVISEWDIDSNNSVGVFVADTTDCFVIRDVWIHSDSWSWEGIYLQNVTNGAIERTWLWGNYIGLYAIGCSDIAIYDSVVAHGGWAGVTIEYCERASVHRNEIVDNGDSGIDLLYSNNTTIADNDLSSHWYGLDAGVANHATISGNTFTDNVYAILWGGSVGTIIVGNTILDNPGAPGLWLQEFEQCQILDNVVSGNQHGICLWWAGNCTLSGNNVSGNGENGIDLYEVTNTTVTGNEVWVNPKGISVNTGYYVTGDVIVIYNNVHDNGIGIYCWATEHVSIEANRIEGNAQGVSLNSCLETSVTHNDFVNNSEQAFDNLGPGNFWDDGYPSGGNFWSDYEGADLDHDGIGDTPYSIDSDSSDLYPLMEPYGTNRAPVAILTASPVQGNPDTVFVFDASGSSDFEDPIELLEFRWDFEGNGTWSEWASTCIVEHQYETLAIRSIGLDVRDTNGRIGKTSIGVSVLDDQAPLTSATIDGTAGSNGWYISDVTISLTATDRWSEIERTRYRIGSGAWYEYTSELVFQASGARNLSFYSRDASGNVEDVRMSDIRIDRDVPTTEIIVAGIMGENNWLTGSVSFALSGVDLTSGIQQTLFRTNGGPWTQYSSAVSIPEDQDHEGTLVLDFYSVDMAGHAESIQSETLRTDWSGPSASVFETSGIMNAIGSAEEWYVSEVSVEFSAIDGASGVDRIRYRFDGGLWQDYSAELVVSSDGQHALEFLVIDFAGHASQLGPYAFKIDQSAPVLFILGPDDGETVSSSKVRVDLVATDSLSGLRNVSVRLDDGAYMDATAFSIQMSGLSNGEHTISARAIDNAGNVVEAAVEIEVNTRIFSLDGPAGPWAIIGIAIAVASATALLLWIQWSRRRGPLHT